MPKRKVIIMGAAGRDFHNFNCLFRNNPDVEVVAFWLFRLPRPARNFNDYFAFVGPDFTPRPIYYAVRAWALGE